MNFIYRNIIKSSLLLLITVVLFSCRTYKNIPYFNDVPDSIQRSVKLYEFKEPIIQYDDILYININTLDAQTSSSNALTASSTLNLQPQNAPTFRVDKAGQIELPLIGKIQVEGRTTSQVKNIITDKVAVYYKMPVVDVKLASFKITVLGEVLRPGSYNFMNEKVTVFDALGSAGDLTIFGKRENVLLIRDSADKKQFVRLNLNSKKLIASPHYYLQQNDVIYIEPSNQKLANLDAVQIRYISIISAVMSFLTILATRIK